MGSPTPGEVMSHQLWGKASRKYWKIQGKAKYPGKDTVSHVQKEEYFLTSPYCKEGTQESNCARQGS